MNKSLTKVCAESFLWAKLIAIMALAVGLGSAVAVLVNGKMNTTTILDQAIYFCDGKNNIKNLNINNTISVTCADGRSITIIGNKVTKPEVKQSSQL